MLNDLGTMIRNRRARAAIYSQPDYWNRKADELTGKAASMWPNNHLNELYHAEILAVLDRSLPDPRGWRILEVGSGTGRLARYLAAKGARVTGIDFAERAVAVARARSFRRQPPLSRGIGSRLCGGRSIQGRRELGLPYDGVPGPERTAERFGPHEPWARGGRGDGANGAYPWEFSAPLCLE